VTGASNKIAFFGSIGLFAIVNFLVTMAFVISPTGSVIPQMVDRYKLGSLILGCALYLVFLRRGWMIPALLVPIVQLAAALWFANYIIGLPRYGVPLG
jgi:hypothetical protein